MSVTIGIDPHKASHHAVAVDDHEQELAQTGQPGRMEQGPHGAVGQVSSLDVIAGRSQLVESRLSGPQESSAYLNRRGDQVVLLPTRSIALLHEVWTQAETSKLLTTASRNARDRLLGTWLMCRSGTPPNVV